MKFELEAVAFLLVKDGHVLMEKCAKKAKVLGGKWFIPGGKIEEDESPPRALTRELREELGVVGHSYSPLPLVDAGTWMKPFLMGVYQILDWDADIPKHVLDYPENELRWVPIEEARRSPVTAVRMMVAMLPLDK